MSDGYSSCKVSMADTIYTVTARLKIGLLVMCVEWIFDNDDCISVVHVVALVSFAVSLPVS